MTALTVLAEMPLPAGVFLQPPVPPREPTRIAGESERDFRERHDEYHQNLRQYDAVMRLYNAEVRRIDSWLARAREPHGFFGRSSNICVRCWGWYDDPRHT